MDAFLYGAEAELVGGAVGHAALEAAAGQPDGEAPVVVVAAIAALRCRRAAELAAPEDERLIEQAALFQVLQQGGDRLDPTPLRRLRCWPSLLPCVSHGWPVPE